MYNKAIYGLVGYPLGHSLSPLMHNAAFEALQVDAEYQLFPLKESDLDDFFKSLKEKNNPIFGLNITVPYKETVIKYLDGLDAFVEKVSAVNTIVISGKRKLTGYNTDGPGFLSHISELNIETSDKRIAIIGAGGASRAIISALCLITEKPESIKIFDIDFVKAENLLFDIGKRIDVSNVECVNSIDDLNIEFADLLINATPVGLKNTDPCVIDESFLHKNLFVYDVIYNPKETKLLKSAKMKGAKTSNGLGMLYYQGVLAFQHWANVELDDSIKNVMKKALEDGANKL